MPGQIVNSETNKLATNELPENVFKANPPCELENPHCIPENEEMKSGTCKPPIPEIPLKKYVWRIDLSKSEPFWTDWFKGLSEMFLSLPVPKLLILAGIENLDKTLTVGQMQGKFQLQVLARTGHAVVS